MVDLAEQPTGKFIPLHEISERQNISEKYLEAILRKLVKGGLLDGRRGKKGGYRLTKFPSEYNLYEILEIAEDTIAPVACLAGDARGCERVGQCRTYPTWLELDQLVREFLSSKTLIDLARRGPSEEEKHSDLRSSDEATEYLTSSYVPEH